MRKVKALTRYQIIELKRDALIWGIAILFAIGVEQCISSMYISGNLQLTLVGFIMVSWLPLNFIMVPVLLISMKIGSNDNDIFYTMDISRSETMLSKILSLAIVDGIILLVNLVIFLVIAIIAKVALDYFLYQLIGYFINTFIFLIVCSSLGLFLGQVISKYLGEVIGFISTLLLFLMLCNFYKTDNFIFPLINLRIFTNSFDVIAYDRSYYYHNLLWLFLAFIIITISFMFNKRKKENKKIVLIRLSACFSLFVICICLIWNMILLRPNLYEIETIDKHQQGQGISNGSKLSTYFGDKNCGYYINKYTMDLNIGNELKNTCQMEIVVDGDSLTTVEFGLYEKLNIENIEAEGENLRFSRTDNSVKVDLPKEYEKGDTIKIKMQYCGYVNTVWLQGREFFHVRDNSIFLADVFEWYPKLNDNKIKEYNLDIKYDGKNNIYSNLNTENKVGEYILTGQENEIFLVSNKMVERTYKNYLLIGNEEYIESDTKCDRILSNINKYSNEDKKIILSIRIPGNNNIGGNYKNSFLYSLDN